MMIVAGFIGALGLTGCASSGAPVTGQAVAAKGVVAAEQTLTLAYQAGDVYARLPRCGTAGASVVCSDPMVLAKMVVYGRKATDALAVARQNESMVGAAWTAITDFQNMIPTPTVPKT